MIGMISSLYTNMLSCFTGMEIRNHGCIQTVDSLTFGESTMFLMNQDYNKASCAVLNTFT